MFLSYKHDFKQRTIHVLAQFRLAFPQRPAASKIAIQKNILSTKKDGTCLNSNKTRIKVRMEDNITVLLSECKRNGRCNLESLKDLKILAISGKVELIHCAIGQTTYWFK